MKISVVIPVYNEEQYIKKCLEAIMAQTRPADEIIVVDNNSTDKTIEIAKTFPVKTVNEKKQGIIPARNRGFAEAKGDIIARTDADTIVGKNWLKKIETAFEKDSALMGLSGPARFSEVPSMVQVSNWPTNMFFKSLKQILKHDCLFGPNMSLRKTAWNKVKKDVCLKDTQVHEDIDLSIHLAFYGKIKYDPKLVVESSPRRWKKLAPYFNYSYRYFRTIQRHKLALNKGRKLMKKVSKKILKNTVSAIFPQ